MLSFNMIMWLTINLLFYIIFSVNILISLLSFVLLVCVICVMLLFLHVEYPVYVLLLIYLGGVLIFFLFLILLLHNESKSSELNKGISFDSILALVMFFKLFFIISLLNDNLTSFLIQSQQRYNTLYLSNNIYITDLLEVHGDISYFISLYSISNVILLIVLGIILLFSMIGVIMITKQKDA